MSAVEMAGDGGTAAVVPVGGGSVAAVAPASTKPKREMAFGEAVGEAKGVRVGDSKRRGICVACETAERGGDGERERSKAASHLPRSGVEVMVARKERATPRLSALARRRQSLILLYNPSAI